MEVRIVGAPSAGNDNVRLTASRGSQIVAGCRRNGNSALCTVLAAVVPEMFATSASWFASDLSASSSNLQKVHLSWEVHWSG